MKTLKTYSGKMYLNGGRKKVCVAATSKERAIEILSEFKHFDLNNFIDEWIVTYGKVRNTVAKAAPETVFISFKHFGNSVDGWKKA